MERMLKHRNKGCLFHLIVAFLMCFLHDMAFAFADEGDPTARFTNKELFEGIKKIALEHKNGGKRSPEYVPAVWKSSPIPVKIISLSESSSIERVRRSIDNINGDLWGTIFLRVVEVASSSRNFFHNGQFVLKNTSPLIFGINIFIVEKDAYWDVLQKLAFNPEDVRKSRCYANFWSDASKEFRRANIILTFREKSKIRKSCIYEEILHVLGFINDVRGVPYSEVSRFSSFDHIGEMDACILKFLYGPIAKMYRNYGSIDKHNAILLKQLRPHGKKTSCRAAHEILAP
ncbi:MAG: DUF2927 domain-containing protein [Alphaproteobacteria bacterium]|nr:DUF2927 domain-containing protein [Alphaproteobacteria bacterium]